MLWGIASVIAAELSVRGSHSLNTPKLLAGLLCLYIAVTGWYIAFPDTNSINTFITVVSCFIIIGYLQSISEQKKYFLLLVFMLAFLHQTFIAYGQAFANEFAGMSVQGSFYNSGSFGNYLCCFIPLLLSAFFNLKNNRLRAVSMLLLISSGVLLTVTTARAAWIGAISGCLVVLCSSMNLKGPLNPIKIFIFLLVPVIIFFSKLMYEIKPRSALGRLTVYEVSAAIIGDNPLFGIGPNRFSAVYNDYQSFHFQGGNKPIDAQLRAGNTFEAFNSIVQIVVEYGIVGAALFAALIYVLFRNCRLNRQGWMALGSLGCLAAVVVASLFSNPFHVSPAMLVFCFHLAVVFNSTTPQWLTFLRKAPCIIISFAWILLVVRYAIIQIRAEAKWSQAATMAQLDNYDSAKPLYAQVYSALKDHGDFLFNYGAEACLNNESDLAIQLLERAKRYSSFSNLFIYLGNAYSQKHNFELAEKNYLHGIHIVPSHIYPKYQLIQLYKKWNKPQLSKEWAVKTIAYPVKVRTERGDELRRDLIRSIGK